MSVHFRKGQGLLDCASAGDGGELLCLLACDLVLRLGPYILPYLSLRRKVVIKTEPPT